MPLVSIYSGSQKCWNVQVKTKTREICMLDLSFDNTINTHQGNTCKILSQSNYICRSYEVFAIQMYCKDVTKVFE